MQLLVHLNTDLLKDKIATRSTHEKLSQVNKHYFSTLKKTLAETFVTYQYNDASAYLAYMTYVYDRQLNQKSIS